MSGQYRQQRYGGEEEEEEYDDDDIVATPEMCHHCFDTLIQELLPDPSSTSLSSSAQHKHHKSSSKRRLMHTSKRSEDNNTLIQNNDDSIIRKDQQSVSYIPPAVNCPLFVTWSKLRSKHPPPPFKEAASSTSNSGIATPVTTTTTYSSSNITDSSATDDNDEAVPTTTITSSLPQQQHQQLYDESDYDLRGCIGTLAPKSLTTAISEFAITSALHDQRFDPIELHELPYLRVGVSLLVKYETCTNCYDWDVGKHGIIIKFTTNEQRRHNYSATYLPEVAYEQQWSQKEAILSLVRKSGYRGVITDELLSNIHCTRYQSSKYQLSYQEYVYYATNRNQGDDGSIMDPLQNIMTAAAVDEAMRQSRMKSSRPCVNL